MITDATEIAHLALLDEKPQKRRLIVRRPMASRFTVSLRPLRVDYETDIGTDDRLRNRTNSVFGHSIIDGRNTALDLRVLFNCWVGNAFNYLKVSVAGRI